MIFLHMVVTLAPRQLEISVHFMRKSMFKNIFSCKNYPKKYIKNIYNRIVFSVVKTIIPTVCRRKLQLLEMHVSKVPAMEQS